jgi:hypothetical protein
LPHDAGDEFVLQEDATHERPFGWVFFYVNRKYLESQDLLDLVPGNAPVIVDGADGSVHVTGTGRPLDEYLAEYQAERKASE